MTKKQHNILGIDWGKKYIGIAYTTKGNSVIFPLGYLLNDQMIFFSLSELLHKYMIKEIVIGRPCKQKDLQEKIQAFITNLNAIIAHQDIPIHIQEEDYSSVQAGEILSPTVKDLKL